MKVEGRCHCGRITYEASVDPETATLCHCTDCQMLTGSAFRATVRAPSATFTLLTGQPKIYIKTADSGARRAHAFCPDCGTPIHASAVDEPPTYSLRIGCLAQRAALRPRRQNWCQSGLDWAMNLEDVPKHLRQ
jgi:hypothetical protein